MSTRETLGCKMPNRSKPVIALPELDAAMRFALREILALADEATTDYGRRDWRDRPAVIRAGGGGPTYGQLSEAFESLATAIRHTLAGAALVALVAPSDDGTG